VRGIESLSGWKASYFYMDRPSCSVRLDANALRAVVLFSLTFLPLALCSLFSTMESGRMKKQQQRHGSTGSRYRSCDQLPIADQTLTPWSHTTLSIVRLVHNAMSTCLAMDLPFSTSRRVA